MSQTSVAEQAVAFAGMKADAGSDDVLSRVAQGALFDGRLAVVGTDPDRQAKHPAAAGDITDPKKVLGVVVHSHARENQADGLDPNYLDKSVVSLMHKGRIWVTVEEAVTPASAVYVRHAAGAGGTKLGAFRASADTATAALLAGARYLSSAGIAGLALLEVDL